MPFKSDKQRAWMFANKPEMAREWANKYNTGGSVMNMNSLANDFVKTIQRNGVMAGLEMLERHRSALSPQDVANAQMILKRAAMVQGMNNGGSVRYEGDNLARIRRWLEDMNLNPREEALLLQRLGIDPVTRKNAGGMIDPNKKGTFKAQATRAGMSGPAFANKVLAAPVGEYSPELRKKANFAKNFAYKNQGGLLGDMPQYNAGGQLLNHPYNREGEQFDTVPAMLTPGEFVVDADSAHKFGPLLEEVNAWEPTLEDKMPMDEMVTREDEDIKIERKFKDGTKITVHSPEGSKAEISGILSSLVDTAEEDHGLIPVEQKNRGGYINMNQAGDVNQAYYQQLGQQLETVTPQADPLAQARAQQMAGLGFNLLSNASGTPVAGNFGNQLLGVGNRTIEAQQEADALATEQAEEKKTESQAFQNLNTKANDAIGYLNNGWKALMARQAAQERSAKIFGAAYLLPNANVAGIERRESQYIDAFIRKQVREKKIDENQLSALNNLIAVNTELTTTALAALGPGPKTDFDFIVAERSIANLEGTPRTIAEQYNRIRENAKKWMAQSGITPTTADVAIDVPAGVDTIKWVEPEEPKDGWTGNAKETVSNVIDGVSGSGTQEDPYIAPAKRMAARRSPEAKLNYFVDWVERKNIPDTAYIKYKDVVGTVEQLIDSLTRAAEEANE